MLKVTGFSGFARHYFRNLGWFLFLELLRCFSSLGSPPFSYIFREGYPCGWVSPFGHSRIKACLPAPRDFTQATTSFIACNRQGIHHMHLFAWSYNVKTWALLNSNFVMHETSAIGFLKHFIWSHQADAIKLIWTVNSYEPTSFKCFDFAIKLPIEYFRPHHKVLLYSLYFFHFVKDQSSF